MSIGWFEDVQNIIKVDLFLDLPSIIAKHLVKLGSLKRSGVGFFFTIVNLLNYISTDSVPTSNLNTCRPCLMST